MSSVISVEKLLMVKKKSGLEGRRVITRNVTMGGGPDLAFQE
jgi:hypothetical protein